MPPKDDANVIDGTLYFEDENGELRPITVTRDVELTTYADLEDIIPEEYRLPTAHEFSFSLENAPQRSIKLCKLICVNNYRRLHGLRPVRHKVQRHKPEISLFTVKRIIGGFKFR
mgnify:CR=1 FL=1